MDYGGARMKRLVILAMLILAVTSIARAQDPCPQCNKIYEEIRGPSQAVDDNRWRPRRGAPSFALYMRFDASVAVTNDTAKKIKQITWESSLIDVATMKTIATYTLVTRKKDRSARGRHSQQEGRGTARPKSDLGQPDKPGQTWSSQRDSDGTGK